jgi:hypothetical protein
LIEDPVDFFIEDDKPGWDIETNTCGFSHHQMSFLDE